MRQNQYYHETVQRYFDKLLAREHIFRIPLVSQLRTRREGMTFHPTPEVFLQNEGTNEFICPAERFTLKAGEGCLIHSGLPHGEVGRGKRFAGLVICFSQMRLTFLKAVCSPGQAPTVSHGDAYVTPAVTVAMSHMEEITSIRSKPQSRSQLRIDALLKAFFALILETLEQDQGQTSASDLKVIKARDLISSQIGNPELSIAYLAQAVGCSPDHLCRLFKLQADATPNQYIKTERIRYATTLLRDPRLNMSEIAQSTGFSSLNYFSRVFTQTMGCSPTAYRKLELLRSHGRKTFS